MFSIMMHQWALHATSLLSNVIRYCVDTEECFDEVVNKVMVSVGLYSY